jgi:hypothetical protein
MLTTAEWLKKMWYLYTLERRMKFCHLQMKIKWMKLENIILSEVSQVQKAKNQMFSLVEYRCNTNTAIL